jgi:hypothetical protein
VGRKRLADPAATGLRALAVVMTQYGKDTMLAIYDKASQLRPGRAVVDSTVNLAVHGLLAPAPALDTPAGPDADHKGPPPAAGDVDVDQEPTRTTRTTTRSKTPKPSTSCTTA